MNRRPFAPLGPLPSSLGQENGTDERRWYKLVLTSTSPTLQLSLLSNHPDRTRAARKAQGSLFPRSQTAKYASPHRPSPQLDLTTILLLLNRTSGLPYCLAIQGTSAGRIIALFKTHYRASETLLTNSACLNDQRPHASSFLFWYLAGI
ncbi:MAG: hypothetical protein L6R36_005452 [Xanthoria steineri]|nr:MAG: hypothetical protein L6R36_005452 [Xanthoria steineri]